MAAAVATIVAPGHGHAPKDFNSAFAVGVGLNTALVGYQHAAAFLWARGHLTTVAAAVEFEAAAVEKQGFELVAGALDRDFAPEGDRSRRVAIWCWVRPFHSVSSRASR